LWEVRLQGWHCSTVQATGIAPLRVHALRKLIGTLDRISYVWFIWFNKVQEMFHFRYFVFDQ